MSDNDTKNHDASGSSESSGGLLEKAINLKRQRRQEKSLGGALNDLAAYRGSEFGSDTIIEPDSSRTDASGPEERPGLHATDEDKYRIDGEVGRGGMGVILDAFDTNIRREVAMKVITGDWQESREYIGRFIREAQVQGQLEHPNICPVHELGVGAGGNVYFTMKMVKGHSLAEMIREARDESRISDPRRLTEVLNIFLKICDGLAFAHSRGIIHRDLKPDNIMIGDFGEVYVMDWGLARTVESDDDSSKDGLFIASPGTDSDTMRTMSGSVVGTPSYMPPEQAAGRVNEMDERSDIYSLGALLYELLCLEPPFTGDSPWEILRRIGREEPILPSRKNPAAVSDELDSIVKKCLAKNKDDRYQSVRALKHEIELLVSGRPIGAMEYSLWQVFLKWVSRNKALSASAMTVMLILAAAFAVSYVRISSSQREALRQRDRAEGQRIRAEEQQIIAERQRAAAEAERRTAERERRKAETSELVSRLTLAKVYEEQRDISSALALYRQLKMDMQTTGINVCPYIDLFRWRVLYNDGHSIRVEATARSRGAGFRCVAFGPQASLLAVSSNDLTVQLWNPMTGQPLGYIRGFEAPVTSMSFSPDGRLLATGDAWSLIKIWDLKHGRHQAVLTDSSLQEAVAHLGTIECLAFSPDGRLLASGGDEVIKIWNVERGVLVKTLWGHISSVSSLAFEPDGRHLISGGKDSHVKRWNLDAEQEYETLYEHWKKVYKVAVNPDGTVLASASGDTTIKLWNLAQKRLIATLRGHESEVTSLDFSSLGGKLMSGGCDQTVRFWDMERLDVIAVFKEHTRKISSVAFSPAGDAAASAGEDGTIKVWSLSGDHVVQDMPLQDFKISDLAFSPDSKILAVGTWAPKVVPTLFVDPVSGDITDRWMNHGNRIQAVAFSPDGTAAASVGDDGLLITGTVATREERAIIDVVAEKPVGFISSILNTTLDYLAGGQGEKWNKAQDAVAYSPDGTLLATVGGDSVVRLWDTVSHRPVNRFTECTSELYCCAFSPDGRLLAAGGQGQGIVLWDMETRRFKTRLLPGRSIDHIVFSPDNTYLAACGDGSGIFRWNRSTEEYLAPLEGHSGGVVSLDFHPDGLLLVSGSVDTNIKIWDFAAGRCIITLREHESDVEAVEFNPDGSLLVSGGRDRVVKIWRFGDSLKRFEPASGDRAASVQEPPSAR